jgi:Uma2 family endonuclease
MATSKVITDEELMQLPKDGSKREVVDGELRVVSPAGWYHEQVVVQLIAQIAAFVRANHLGLVLGSNAMYKLPDGSKRCPDVSFIAATKLPLRTSSAGVIDTMPDLVVEVLSPNDKPSEVLGKVGEYLEAGARLVWVVDPDRKKAVAHRSLSEARDVSASGSFDGEDVLPGFSCLLTELLD